MLFLIAASGISVEKYVIVETLDEETCNLCSGLDGTVYDVPKEMKYPEWEKKFL